MKDNGLAVWAPPLATGYGLLATLVAAEGRARYCVPGTPVNVLLLLRKRESAFSLKTQGYFALRFLSIMEPRPSSKSVAGSGMKTPESDVHVTPSGTLKDEKPPVL